MQPSGQRQHSQCSANSAVALLVMTLHRQTTQSRACLLLSVSTGAKTGWGHSPRTRMSSKWISQESPGGQSTSFTQRSKPKGLTGTELCPKKVGLHPTGILLVVYPCMASASLSRSWPWWVLIKHGPAGTPILGPADWLPPPVWVMLIIFY